MTIGQESDSPPGLRLGKSFEGQGPQVIWQVTIPSRPDLKRVYLILDANQASFGARLEATRTDDLKPGGAVVAQLRKVAPSGYAAAVLRSETNGDLWIPIFRSRGPEPDLWMQLAHRSPPEVRLVDASGVILVRKSSQGSYTKRRPLDGPGTLPLWPPSPDFRDQLPLLLPAAVQENQIPRPSGEDLPQGVTAETEAKRAEDGTTDGGLLPEYQREARDRLARRLKTLRKSLERLEREAAVLPDPKNLEREALLLKAHLHEIRDGLASLTVHTEDGQCVTLALEPDLGPGDQLERTFERVRKARTAAARLHQEVEKARTAMTPMTADLAMLRAAPLPLGTVTQVLARHQLAAPAGGALPKTRSAPTAQPFKTYFYRSTPSQPPVPIHVGKGAEGSDILVKNAKANDLWLHIVGATGSHVIVPARALPKGPVSEDLLRHAAMLAVFHSKLRESHAGEVYVSRKQHLRKRKGMAPGLWQIDKAESIMVRYSQDELQPLLSAQGSIT